MVLIIILLIIVIIMQSIALERLLEIAKQETGYVLENLELHRKVKELTEKK
jgi:hypothetical protein